MPRTADPTGSPEPVSSPRNARVLAAGRLHRARGRRDSGRTIIEGPHTLAEAVDAEVKVREVFGLEDDEEGRRLAAASAADWIPVTRRVLDKLASTETPRGPVAIVDIPPEAPIVGDSVWMETSDPGNAGTIIRTAAAFGLAVIVADDAVDPWSPKVLRAAAGGHFKTRIRRGPPPAVATVATVVAGGVPLDELSSKLGDDPVCVLIGNEAHGLSSAVLAKAEIAVTIPMPGAIESLNAGVSAAIVMAEVARHRGWNIGSGSLRTPN